MFLFIFSPVTYWNDFQHTKLPNTCLCPDIFFSSIGKHIDGPAHAYQPNLFTIKIDKNGTRKRILAHDGSANDAKYQHTRIGHVYVRAFDVHAPSSVSQPFAFRKWKARRLGPGAETLETPKKIQHAGVNANPKWTTTGAPCACQTSARIYGPLFHWRSPIIKNK